MSSLLQCPHCKGTITVDPEDAGYRLTCPHCQNDFVAPPLSDLAKSAGAAAPQNESPTQPAAEDDWLSFDEKPVMQSADSDQATPSGGFSSAEQDLLGQYVDLETSTANPAGPPNPPSIQGAALVDIFGLGDGTEPLPNAPSPSGNQPSALGESLDLPDFLDDGSFDHGSTTPAEDEVQYATEYRIKCKVCGTPRYVKARQAGAMVKCVDCHSSMTVPQPPKVPKKAKIEQVTAAPHPAAQFPASPAPVGPRRDPFQKNAEELLDEAERAGAGEEPPNLDNPDIKEWLKNVFGVFLDIGVVAHWLALSLMASVPAYLALRSQHPVLILGMFPFSLLVLALVTACGFAVLESVANNEDHVENWPFFDPIGWATQLFLAVAATVVSVVPAWLFGSTLFGVSLVTIGLTMFSVYVLFPFVLLSMLDMESPFVPFSTEVARSVTNCSETWGGTYFSSALLFIALFFVLIFFGQSEAPSSIFVTITATIGVAFIYFAMIGRLAFAIGQSVNGPERDE